MTIVADFGFQMPDVCQDTLDNKPSSSPCLLLADSFFSRIFFIPHRSNLRFEKSTFSTPPTQNLYFFLPEASVYFFCLRPACTFKSARSADLSSFGGFTQTQDFYILADFLASTVHSHPLCTLLTFLTQIVCWARGSLEGSLGVGGC